MVTQRNFKDMKLIKIEEKVLLKNLPSGSMFTLDKIENWAIKTQYCNEAGGVEGYLHGTGEMFWGGTDSPDDLNNLSVYPVKMVGISKGSISDESD
jgi:hypothetical protein